MEKIFAIGDIHGCLSQLKNMIAAIDPDEEGDTIVFMGDYIDRGPDSKGVVDCILHLRERVRKVICLMGNHEQMFLEYMHAGAKNDIFLSNGGRATLASYGYDEVTDGETIMLPDTHKGFLQSLVPYYETGHHIFVHAGLRPGVALEKQDLEDILWIRYEFIYSSYDFGKVVVFGHTPVDRPLVQENKIGIDTGAVFGGALTCIEFPGQNIYQV
jgi:serine/threonine protein phosphatase 1